MTALDLITLARTTGIRLQARGPHLHVEAPEGTLTPELRIALISKKAELLALLSPAIEFVSLKGGLVVPVPAWLLALDLERRRFRMFLDHDERFQIEPW